MILKKRAPLFFACFFLHVAAILVTWVYESSKLPRAYDEALNWSQFSSGLTNLNVEALKKGIGLSSWLLLFAIGGGIAMALRSRTTSAWSLGFFTVQPVIFGWAWVGLLLWLALPFEVFRLDGEWFEEQTPLLLSSGLWIGVCALCAFAIFKQRRRDRVAA